MQVRSEHIIPGLVVHVHEKPHKPTILDGSNTADEGLVPWFNRPLVQDDFGLRICSDELFCEHGARQIRACLSR